MNLRKLLRKVKIYIEITKVDEVARGYLIMNAFDGALTMLGVIIGAYMVGVIEPPVIISAGIGGSLAMGISGFFGAYMTERAERARRLKTLERSMLAELDNSILGEASRFAPVFTAIIDGLSPALSAIAIITPFWLALLHLFPIEYAFISSIIISLPVLFTLGAFLGKMSQENILIYGLTMTTVGLITAFLCILLLSLP